MFVSYVQGLPASSVRYVANAHQDICEIVFNSADMYYNIPRDHEFSYLEVDMDSETHATARVILRNGDSLYEYEMSRIAESIHWDTTLKMGDLASTYSSYILANGGTIRL